MSSWYSILGLYIDRAQRAFVIPRDWIAWGCCLSPYELTSMNDDETIYNNPLSPAESLTAVGCDSPEPAESERRDNQSLLIQTNFDPTLNKICDFPQADNDIIFHWTEAARKEAEKATICASISELQDEVFSTSKFSITMKSIIPNRFKVYLRMATVTRKMNMSAFLPIC